MRRPRSINASIGQAGQLFVRILCTSRISFTNGVARAIWQMIADSSDSEAAAFRFATGHLLDAMGTGDTQRDQELVARYFSDWLTPDLLIQALDELVERERISRTAATRLQTEIHTCTMANGQWAWVLEEKAG